MIACWDDNILAILLLKLVSSVSFYTFDVVSRIFKIIHGPFMTHIIFLLDSGGTVTKKGVPIFEL